MKPLGLLCVVATAPLLWVALAHLAGREYVAGALVVFAAAAVGHLGLELVSLASRAPEPAAEDGEEPWPSP